MNNVNDKRDKKYFKKYSLNNIRLKNSLLEH